MGLQAHLEQDLDEDAGGGGGVVLGQADALQDLPADGVLLQQRAEEFGHVAQLVGLQAVDQRVLPPEALLKALLVGRELDCKARRQQGVVPAGEATRLAWAVCQLVPSQDAFLEPSQHMEPPCKAHASSARPSLLAAWHISQQDVLSTRPNPTANAAAAKRKYDLQG